MLGDAEEKRDEPCCCISHLFLSSASKTPDRIAVVHSAGVRVSTASDDRLSARSPSRHFLQPGDDPFTFDDVVKAVDSLSRRILRAIDGDPELPKGFHGDKERPKEAEEIGSSDGTPCIVGVHIAPSVEYIVAVLSILRCGAAFLPLDPFWPEERILSILSSSKTSLIIKCKRKLDAADRIVDESNCSVLYLSMREDEVEDHFDRCDLLWPCESKSPRKFCYLMYTSGSTGKPKGVCGTEKGLLNRFWWMQQKCPIHTEDIVLFKTSISFVDHLQEFLGAILTCARLVVPPFAELKSNPLYVVKFLKAYHISRLTAVPSLMRVVLPSLKNLEWMQIYRSLKVLILSGETLPLSLWKDLHKLFPETTILNLYGSTEVSGDCTYFDCRNLRAILVSESLSSVPIGIPISNCEIDLAIEPDMADAGEIIAGGICLMAGYFGESFYGYPLSSCFRTGDFARRLRTGDLVFLGRKDRTIKINGQRVALEEIENALRDHPEVVDAAVTYCGTTEDPSHLDAYFVMEAERFQKEHTDQQYLLDDLIMSIRSCLVRKLPPAMVPSRFFRIQVLPVSASGKINYAMLENSASISKHLTSGKERNHSFDRNLQIIKEAFCDALLVKEVLDFDDFFLIGGNSISAAHAAYKLGIDMRMLYIFSSPVKLLYALLDSDSSWENLFSTNHDSWKPLKAHGNFGSDEESVRNSSLQLNVKQSMSQLKKIDGSPFNDVFLPITSVLPASNGPASVDSAMWFSNVNPQITCSYSRCNQFLYGGELEFGYIKQSSLSVTISRHKKRCSQELWKVPLTSCVDASPLIVFKDGGMDLFIGSHSYLFLCIDAVRGFLRWEVRLEGRIECSAAITGDFSQIVVGCYKGKIYFLDYMTGNISWSFQTDGEVKMQPVVDKLRNLIWCGSHDHWLYALDYKACTCCFKISCGGSIYGSPSINLVHNMIYVASTSGLITGVSLEVAPFSIVWRYESGAPIFGSLSVDYVNGNVISCLVNGHVIALNSKGSVVWKATIGGPIFAGSCISSALPYQVLICSRNGSVYSFDTEDGALLWEYEIGDPITASAYVDEQTRLISDPSLPCDRLVCVCSSSGCLRVLRVSSDRRRRVVEEGVPERRTVEEFAKMDLSGEVFSSPVMIGGRIFVGCRDDHVHCIAVNF